MNRLACILSGVTVFCSVLCLRAAAGESRRSEEGIFVGSSKTVTQTVVAHRAVSYVAAKGVDGPGRGYSDAPYASIQRAIDESEPGCEIRVGAGTFAGFTDNGNAYRIVGAGNAKTIVDGKGKARCATLEGGSTLVGMTLRNGQAANGGGAISGRLEDCIVEKCHAVNTDVEVCGGGGGAYGSELVRCIVRNNISDDDGGGLANGSACQTLFVGNKALNLGGGDSAAAASGSALTCCTVVGNVSTIVERNGYGAVDECSLVNCVVANNVDQFGATANGGVGVSSEHVCFYPASGMEYGELVFSADPRFANAKKGNYRLADDSPCINWGGDDYVGEGELDLDGGIRIRKGRVDLGCYESDFARPKVSVKLDANGGKVSETKFAFEMGGVYGALPEPTRKGYRFVEWRSAKSGGAFVAEGEPLVSYTAHTLYAQWVHVTTIRVNDGQVSGLGAYTGEEGERVWLDANDRTESGYVFCGWTASPATASLGEGFDGLESSCELTLPSVDVTLTANYIYKPAYLTVEVGWDDPAGLGGESGIEWSVDGKTWYSTERSGRPVKGGTRTSTATTVRFRSVNPRWSVTPAQRTVNLLREESYMVQVTAVRRGTVAWRAESEDERDGRMDHGSGTVKSSPADGVLSGKGVTLTATPAKDAVFVGWMDEDGRLVSLAEKYTIAPGETMRDYLLVPRFRLKRECVEKADLSLDVSRASRIMVGVNYMLPVSVNNDLALPLAFSAKNLPAGLKIDAAGGRITGLPTKAGVFKATVTATSKADKKVSVNYPLTFNVAPLPSWAKGNFTGSVTYAADEEWDDDSWEYVSAYEHAPVSLTVGATGAFSSKGKVDGMAYTMKGSGYLPFDDDAEGPTSAWNAEDPSLCTLRLSSAVTVGKDKSSSVSLELRPLPRETESFVFTSGCGEGGLRYVRSTASACSGISFAEDELPISLWREVSGEKSLANAFKHMAGTYCWGGEDDYDRGWLTVTVDAKGKVKATGRRPEDGTQITATSSLLIGEDGTFCTLLHQAARTEYEDCLHAYGCCSPGWRKIPEFHELIPIDYWNGSDELQPWFEGQIGDIANAMVGVPLSLKVCADWDETDLTFAASGLPKGLSINAKTGVISGTPAAAFSGNVYVSVKSKSDKKVFGSVVIPVVQVAAVPTWAVGNYAGLICREDLGWGSFSATVSDKGQVSGKMTFGNAMYSFKANSFDANSSASGLAVTASATAKMKEPLDVFLNLMPLEFEVGGQVVTEAVMTSPYDAGELVSVLRNGWSDKTKSRALSASGIVGRHTATFNEGNDGYLTCTVDAKGVVKASGKTGDGTAYSASGFLVVPNGWCEAEDRTLVLSECEVALYAVPKGYGGGYVALPLRFCKSEDGVWLLCGADRDGISCNLSSKATENYGEGAAWGLFIKGCSYDPKILLGDVARCLRPIMNEQVLRRYDKKIDDVVEWYSIWMACLDSSEPNWLRVTVSGSKVSVPKATKGSVGKGFFGKNDANFSMKFDAKTGVFSGSYTLWYDVGVSATYSYEGVWVQNQGELRAVSPSFGVGFDAKDKPYEVRIPGSALLLKMEND